MRKKTIILLLALCLPLLFAGCGGKAKTTKTNTYDVDTGDKVKIEFDTSDGYDLSSKAPFTISKDDKDLTQGTFISADQYESYVGAAKSDPKATVIKEGARDSVKYVFWSYDGEAGTEYDYAVLIKDSKTGLLWGNLVSEDSAKDCFGRMNITLDK